MTTQEVPGMAKYLFTARTPGNKELASEVEAESASAARQQLQAMGLREIVIQTDDFAARMYGKNLVNLPDNVVLPPTLLLKVQKRGGGTAGLLLGMLKDNALFFLPLLAWNGYSLYSGHFDWSDLAGFAFTGMMLLTVIWFAIPAILFESLLQAQLWARWQEAERKVAQLRRFKQGATLAPHMLDYYQAKNLIGMGHVEEGLALYDRHRGTGLPDMLWMGLKASLLDLAKRRGEAGELMRRLTEVMPDSGQVWLDFALNQAFYGRLERAKQAVDEAERRELSPIMAGVAPFVRGEIALREHRYAEAVELFGKSLRALSPFIRQTALRPMIIVIEARYAVALAYCGKLDAARQAWRIASPMLTARGEQELLDDWAAAESAAHAAA